MDYSTPTLPTVASRIPAIKSRDITRGTVVHNNRTYVYESNLEQNVLRHFLARVDVADVIDQPPAVNYTDEDGNSRRHTFDFLVKLKDGSRHLVAVKPKARVAKSGIRKVIRLIAEQISNDVADKVHLVTDKNFTRADHYNNRQATECLKFPIGEHDALVERIAGDLTGAVKISDLVKASGLGGMGFRAVVRLIAQGTLIPSNRKARITPASCVSRRAA